MEKLKTLEHEYTLLNTDNYAQFLDLLHLDQIGLQQTPLPHYHHNLVSISPRKANDEATSTPSIRKRTRSLLQTTTDTQQSTGVEDGVMKLMREQILKLRGELIPLKNNEKYLSQEELSRMLYLEEDLKDKDQRLLQLTGTKP